MSGEKNLKSWKRSFDLCLRGLRFFFKRYPKAMISETISIAWRYFTPYVGIHLSALIIEELSGARGVKRLQFLILVALVAAAVVAAGTALLRWWENYHGTGWWYKVEHIYGEKILQMDYVDLDTPEIAERLSRIRDNANGPGMGIFKMLENYEEFLRHAMGLLGGVALTVSLFTSRVPESAGAWTILNNPLFILLIIAVMLAITYISPALHNKAQSFWSLNADKHSGGNRLYGFYTFLGVNSDNAADVRIYRQHRFIDRYHNNKEITFHSRGYFAMLARGAMGAYRAASAATSMIFTGVAYLFVCLKAWAGAFGLGYVTQYVGAITKLSESVGGVIKTMGDMRANAPFLEQVFDFLDIPNNMYQGSLTVEKRRDRKYNVEFRDVSFKYPGSEQYALRHVTMKFEVGKRLAVVGMNGSGKTTFIKLLCRLYDPTEGEILLNGIDIRKYNYAEYMMIFAVVFQDFKLFALKLGENVAGGSDFDCDRVTDCLYKAGFGERLRTLPHGIDTYLYSDYDKDGVNVSGGEAQKIAIARALYKNAPFIVLDEPTAALDPIAEAEIYEKFDAIAGDKTAIYISHRLSSCKFCDEIAVFHEGSVVQHGTHEALLADEQGKYAELWNAQAQYYVET